MAGAGLVKEVVMAGVTKVLYCAWDRECRGLAPEEAGALWALTAAAECGWFGREGSVNVTPAALSLLMYGSDALAEKALALVRSLKAKGRVTCQESGSLVIGVCFWTDRWAKERARKRFDRGVR